MNPFSFDCVLALAEFRNTSKAAESLYITQPALSLRIQRLEKELGITIFDRSTRPISITPAGELYIREMSRLRMAEEQLMIRLGEMSDREGKTITLGIGFNRGQYWLPELLPSLMEQYPDYVFQVREAPDLELETGVQNGEIDYAIVGFSINSDEVAALEIGTEKIYIGVPASNPLLNDVPGSDSASFTTPCEIDAKALNGETLILGQNSYGLTRYVNVLFSTFHILPGRIIHVGNTDTSYLLAAKGLGIAFVFDGKQEISLGEKMQRPVPCVIKDAPLQRNVSLICKASRKESALTKAIYMAIKDYHQRAWQYQGEE